MSSDWTPGQRRNESPVDSDAPPDAAPPPEKRTGNRLLKGCGIGSIGCLTVIGLGVVALVVIVIIAVASSGSDDNDAEVVDSSEDRSEDEASGDDEETVDAPDVLNLEVGQTARVGDAEVTVHGCRLGSSDLIPADPGFRYVIVDATVTNTGDDAYNISSLLQTSVRDADSREYTVTIGPEQQGQLDGSIQVGESLRGESVFEVPDGVALQWAFEQSITGTQEARWNITCQ